MEFRKHGKICAKQMRCIFKKILALCNMPSPFKTDDTKH